MKPKNILKFLLSPISLVLALFLLFEEWLWDRLTTLNAWISSFHLIQKVEAYFKALSPYQSLVLFVIPAAVIFPFKIVALEMIAKGRYWEGLAVILTAKLLGTAVVTRIFLLTREKVLQIPWFFFLYSRVNAILQWARRFIVNSLAYRMIQKAKAYFKRL